MTFGGVERTFRVYRPASLGAGAKAPLVVVLHGGFGTGEQAEKSYHWDAAADRGGFVVAFPDGLHHAWNAGACCGKPQKDGVDDVGFLTAMIRRIESAQHIDASRIAVAGMSNGAMMAYAMACESPLHLRAIGSVSGTLVAPCAHPKRTSVLEIHGTADQNVPYAGGKGMGPAQVQTQPIRDVIARWRDIDDCALPVTATSGAVTTLRAMCADHTAVELISVAGAGHQWPGGAPPNPALARLAHALGYPGIDPPSRALDATQTLVQFFFGDRR